MYSLKPADNNPQQPNQGAVPPQQQAPAWNPPPQQDAGTGGWKFPVLLVGILGLAGANFYQYNQISHMKEDVVKVQKSLQDEIATVKETSAVSTQTQRQTINSLKDDLTAARRRAESAAGQAKVEALAHADQLASKLASAQQKQEAMLSGKISEVQSATEAASTKIGEVSTEVGNVKTEVSANKSEIDKTIQNLKRVQGDLGDQGSLIATNGKELQALKMLGERNYFEFKLAKAKNASKVGDIMLLLKKTDPKKNRFTVEVIADDKNVEKRDRTVNEPIQFLTSKARQPYEIVVNNVSKDVISGYLATPKVTNTRQ
jgi:hypothetical protein